jgi:PAP2 superfamily
MNRSLEELRSRRHEKASSTTRRARTLAMAVLIAVAGMIPAASVAAAEQPNPVLDWNINAVNAIGNPPANAIPGLGQPPPLAVIHLAMVQGAVYDAVNAIDGGHQPYLSGLPSMPGASRAAAVATAAHDVLVALPPLPPNSPDPMRANVAELYRLYMLDIPDGTAKTQGVTLGRAAATAMNGNRSNDGRFVGTPLWPIGTLKGEWRPVETANANVFAWVANVRPFTLRRTSQFRTAGPYDLLSPEWAAEFNEVKMLGSNDPTTRTLEQNRLASFVSFNLFSAFNRTLREIAVAKGLSTAEQAMLFVRSSISAADALIGCWDNKEHWLQWRPQTAIRLADQDGNPDTVADPNWTAQFQNPGYPDNPSGFNCFAAGWFYAARQYFGTDKQSFSITSAGTAPLPQPVTRTYTRFTGVIRDGIEGRILIGYHFRSADEQGAWLGKKVAQWVDKHYFGPAD